MARTDFPVLDATGATVDVAGYDNASVITPATVLESASGSALLGQAAMAASLPVVLASDQVLPDTTGGDLGDINTATTAVQATVGATGDAAVSTDTTGTLSGKLRGLVKWAAERMPASLGTKTAAASLPVTLASDEVLPDTIGGDLAAINSSTDAAATVIGSTIDAAVVTDTTGTLSGKLRGLVKWAFERMPASLGQKTKAASLPVTLASDEDDINIATGATDDAAAAGQIFPIAAVYDNTSTDEVDEGDAGRLRMSARRGLLVDADYLLTEVEPADLNSASVTVDGITFEKLQAGLMGSEDGATYGTSAFIVIPMAVANWKSLWFAIKNASTAHNQSIVVSVYISPANSISLSNPRGRVGQFTIPTTADLALVVGEGVLGQGGNPGIATATNLAVYALTVPRGTPYVQILLSATAPTTGSFANFEIGRMS